MARGKSKITEEHEMILPSRRKLYVTHVETDLPSEWLKEKQRDNKKW